ncbi:MAG: methyltransferase domain-containing protein [Chitinophagaceae bacterium]
MNSPAIEGPDITGLKTLETFAGATSFNQWLFDSVAVYCQGNILETGSGIGNISRLLLQKFDAVTLSDFSINYCQLLEKEFQNYRNLKGIIHIDLSVIDFEKKYQHLLGKFDTVIALNVIEHINDDNLAIGNCKKLIKENGRVIILVPAFLFLHNSLDKELGHYKRYTKKKLRELLEQEKLKVIHSKYFNTAGMVGWWLTGSVLKKKIISKGLLRFYNKLVPLFRLMDKVTNRFAGLSVIAVAVKSED